jgi:hypothetical protein
MTEDEKTPRYYNNNGLQPFDVMKAWSSTDTEMTHYEAFFRFNVLKYLWRYRNKNGMDDLQKALHYMQLLIKEYGDENKNLNTRKVYDFETMKRD